MNTFLWIITYIIAILVGIYIGSLIEKWLKTSEKPEEGAANITPEQKKADLSIVYEYFDKYIMQELHNLSTKDITFDEKCEIKLLPSNRYRLLIRCLLNPKQYTTFVGADGNPVTNSFFLIFINKIYLNYISETPSEIKNLVFKYYSGYTKEEYFIKENKRPKKTALPFITEYARNYLWCRYEENDKAEHDILNVIRTGEIKQSPESYEDAMKMYDSACCRKLASNIYHSNDIEDETIDKPVKTDTKVNKTSSNKISEFGYKFTTDNYVPTTAVKDNTQQ